MALWSCRSQYIRKEFIEFMLNRLELIGFTEFRDLNLIFPIRFNGFPLVSGIVGTIEIYSNNNREKGQLGELECCR